jgi:adenosylmethionine---8-amino-7-oxononanoate aminotransferase
VETDLLIAAEKQHLWHPFTQMKTWCAPDHEPLVLVEGAGAILRDSHGREYIDGNSSIWTNIHGHCHPAINAAIKSQLDKVAHVSFLGSTNVPAIELAEKLAGCFPPRTLTRIFYSDDGSTAVEVAVKMSLQYWQLCGRPAKTRFVAFENAYHGDTTGAASLGGVGTFTSRFSAIHFPVERVTGVESLSKRDPGQIAAAIIEPLVQGAAGIRLWPQGMLKPLRAWCDAHDVLLIFDEVLTAFGRTGRLFACEHESVLPDFLCLAKGLTGGCMPLAATLTTERVYEAFLGEYHELKTFFYGHSYCGNPLGCAAALASLKIFQQENTLETLKEKISILRELLDSLRILPNVSDIRQCGYIAGIEIQKDSGEPFPWQNQTGARVCAAARKHGLLTRPILDTIVLMPPLCTTQEQLERAIDAIRRAIREVCQEFRDDPKRWSRPF